MKVMIILMLSILPLLPSFSHGESAECSLENSDSKSNYFVGNKELVGKLAEIYVEDRYGKDNAMREKPYHISDKGNFWQVSGNIDPNATGCVFVIKIDKVNGRIISFTHGK